MRNNHAQQLAAAVGQHAAIARLGVASRATSTRAVATIGQPPSRNNLHASSGRRSPIVGATDRATCMKNQQLSAACRAASTRNSARCGAAARILLVKLAGTNSGEAAAAATAACTDDDGGGGGF
ncbi:hypothetical protein F511_40901 [Dorcoceras hygrometricum]|uniref:Uncharacterized protein n=1 Tax=Dorcoceras hygrometricum TaxID=472368 RepID=A0A2Z7ALJ6_9LAMI|nr:hypothetical protein F511_40901 [Dorcoceras hygrometricum]